MNKVKHILLGSMIILAGCATRTPAVRPLVQYVPPTSGNTAKLVMRSVVPAGENVGVYIYREPVSCGRREKIALSANNAPLPTTTIAANGLVTLEYLTTSAKQFCRIQWSFQAKPNQTYVLAGFRVAEGCRAAILNATNPDQMVIETTALRRDKGTNKPCIPLSESTPVGNLNTNAGKVTDDDLKSLIGNQ